MQQALLTTLSGKSSFVVCARHGPHMQGSHILPSPRSHMPTSAEQAQQHSGHMAEFSLETNSIDTSSSGISDFSTSANPQSSVVLRLECIPAKTLKRIFAGLTAFRWACIVAWYAAFTAMYLGHNGGDTKSALLVVSAATGAACTALLCAALLNFLRAVLKAIKAKHHWTTRRRRLVGLKAAQLLCLLVTNIMLCASSGYGKRSDGCRLFTNFCKWSEYIQWSGWSAALLLQLVAVHASLAWTGPDGSFWRRTMLQRRSWQAGQGKHALILDAPWLIHLPKAVLWLVLQAMLTLQLANDLSGAAYHSIPQSGCLQRPDSICRLTHTYLAAVICQAIAIGVFFCWQVLHVKQGVQDAQRVPYRLFRLGRAMTRLRTNRNLGLSHGCLVDVGLLLATVLRPTKCSSCLGSWMLLAANLHFVLIAFSSSLLFQPISATGSDAVIMQRWLQHFAWTEDSKESRLHQRNSMLQPEHRQLIQNEPMFCFETAVKMLYWCGFVYEYGEGRAEQKLSETTAMDLYSLHELRMLRDPVTQTKCLLAWSTDTIVLAFRGTANYQNATHDVKAWLVPVVDDQLLAGAAVHSGFSASWQHALKQLVLDQISNIIAAEGRRPSDMRVLITGHSLGGVMAVLAAYDIASLFPWQSVQVYTIGAPRPGNRAFARQFNAKVPDTWHIINERDPVPVMAKFWTLYSRPGHRALIDPKGDLLVRPLPLDLKLAQACGRFKAHLLTSYRSSLLQVVKEQLERPKFEDGLQGVLELTKSVSLTETLLAADLDVDSAEMGLAGSSLQQAVTSLLPPEAL